MTFTVIMPCHNAERWVADALRSARDQTRPPEQIIVVNDASSDASAEAIRSSGVEVELIEADVRNAAAARNLALERATSEWIAFLDADDLWRPEHLERSADLLQHGDVGVTGFHDTVFLDGSVRPADNAWPIREASHGLSPQQFAECWRVQMKFSMIMTVMRRDRLEAIGGLDASQLRRHDFEVWLRLIQGRTWAFNPVATAVARHTLGSIGRKNWASSEYFALRGLLKNLEAYPALAPVVRNAARRAVASAFTDGAADDRARAMELASPHLSLRDRLVFGAGRAAPWAIRVSNRIRRRLQGLKPVARVSRG